MKRVSLESIKTSEISDDELNGKVNKSIIVSQYWLAKSFDSPTTLLQIDAMVTNFRAALHTLLISCIHEDVEKFDEYKNSLLAFKQIIDDFIVFAGGIKKTVGADGNKH
jgi:hypothetical protein